MPNSDKNKTDKIKKTVADLELERRAAQAKELAAKALQQGLEKAGEYVHAKRDVIETKLDKAHTALDEKTQGKYADKTAKARAFASRQADRLEERRPAVGATGAAGTRDWGTASETDTDGWSTAGVPVDRTPTDEFPAVTPNSDAVAPGEDPWAVHPDEPGAQPPTT